jgi:eukaryotic-like serine/threonine-protein kinase
VKDLSAWGGDVFDLASRALDECEGTTPFEDFGPYRLFQWLGSGATGEVFLAEDQVAARRVALKFLCNAWSVPDIRRLFTRETQTLARLEHPFIARLYEIGAHPNGTPYAAMEFVDGKPLDEYCWEHACSLPERLRLFRLVCEAVQYAHSRAVIHLDLKPSNILVAADGTPKLLDFGIAMRVENSAGDVTQTQLGCTPAFAAPEQIRREPVGTYTDVYALGVILYVLVGGKHPYAGDTTSPNIVDPIARAQPPARPSSSPTRIPAARSAWNDLDVLCLTAMQEDVSARYHSVLEFIQDIDHFLGSEPLNAKQESLFSRGRKFLRRHRRAVAGSCAAFALLAGVVTYDTIRLTKARDAALAEAQRTQRIQRFMLDLFGGDYNAAPSGELRVVDILDRGVAGAQMLKGEPAVQAELYETLGGIYHSLGKIDQANSLLESGLDEKKSLFGPDSPEVANSLVLLSVLRIDQARYAEAEQMIRQAISIDRRRLPKNSPKLASAISTLGSVLEKRSAFREAIQVLDEAIRIQSLPGANPADLEESLTYSANSQHGLGDDAAAEALYLRLLALDRRIYGDRHPSVAEDFINMGEAEKQMGSYAEAERNERQGIEIIRGWYGAINMEGAIDLEGLAETLFFEHRDEEAAGLFRDALQTLEGELGKDHPYVALALNGLGHIALRRGDLPEAEKDFERMAAIYRARFGERDRHDAVSLLRLGELYEAKGEFARAEQSLRDAIALYAATLAPENVQTGTARIELGGLLLRENRYAEAEKELLAGYQIVTPGRKPSLEAARNARRDLVAVYEALKQPEKAGRFRAEQAAAAQEAKSGN